MTINLPSSASIASLFLVDKSLIAQEQWLVGWEQRIFGNVFILFSVVFCMFGHLTGFLFFWICILVINWLYPFSIRTTMSTSPFSQRIFQFHSVGWYPFQHQKELFLHCWECFYSLIRRFLYVWTFNLCVGTLQKSSLFSLLQRLASYSHCSIL